MESVPGRQHRHVSLTDAEETLRQLLIDVAAYINPKKPSELRITGGWVRDKLLGIQTHDVDVAINDMTGESFGLKMKEYLELPGRAEKYGLHGVATTDDNSKSKAVLDKAKVVHGLHKIAKNPDKSKHLETVTTKLLGIDLDLLNLRKETYAAEDRTPQMEFGTPEEDAMRRDATVNALFYNLQTNLVEDFTGCGLKDLTNGVIRTPLEPYQTFKDDPLRVLRLVRFSSTLGFPIEDSTKEAMKNEDIGNALNRMISRERIGTEVEKMLKGPRPRTALTLIHELDLFDIVFTDPTRSMDFKPDQTRWNDTYTALQTAFEQQGEHPTISRLLLGSEEQRFIAWILAALVPFSDAPVPPARGKAGKAPPQLPVLVVREGIKAPNRVCDVIGSSFSHAKEIISMKDDCLKSLRGTPPSDDAGSSSRETLGMAMRRWGSTWQYQVLYSLVYEMTEFASNFREILEQYEAFLKHVDQLDLVLVNDMKPIIDGNALAKALDTRPGPWMKDAIEVIVAWQLRNPSTATAEGAIDAIKSKHGELTNSLIQHFLRLTVRPLFAKSPMRNITPQARKQMDVSTRQTRIFETPEDGAQGWKEPKNAFAIDLLRWIIDGLDEKRTEEYWPLIIPPLLALVDDIDTGHKTKGCQLLESLFSRTSPTFLARTGLGPVFEEAIELCLSYLPSLTPESESIRLLDAAYPCMLELSCARFPKRSTPQTELQGRRTTRLDESAAVEMFSEKTMFLSRVIHEHILSTISQVSDAHFQLATSMLSHLDSYVKAMGLDIVSELATIIPLLTNILKNPFAVSGHIELPSQAVSTLQSVVSIAWPRIYRWRGEISMGLCICWINLCELEAEEQSSMATKQSTDSNSSKTLARRLQACMTMLRVAMQNDLDGRSDIRDPQDDELATFDWEIELENLVAADDRIKQLVNP